MEDIALSPNHASVNGKSISDHCGDNRDIEEGPFGRIDQSVCTIIGDCDGKDERNPLLGPLHPDPYTLRSPSSKSNQTISFREILPRDRIRIQELFEEWFPVDYKGEFYDQLCNSRSMADQKLYTLLATVSQGDDNETIIACLLGCKLGIRKLNEASRTLLIPGYERTDKNTNKRASDSNSDLNQALDELESGGLKNESNTEDDEDDSIPRKEVFYIMTLGVIEEYRKRGLASYLVERAIQDQIVVASEPIDDKSSDLDKSNVDDDVYEEFDGAEINQRHETTCETAYLHVIIQNVAAIRFYEKLGFTRLREIANYYTINEKKHNCYLYAKFFDRASIIDRKEREKGLYSYYCYHYSKSLGIPMVGLFHRTMTRWISSLWSSVSYYWALDAREDGRNSILAAAKNK